MFREARAACIEAFVRLLGSDVIALSGADAVHSLGAIK